MKKYQRELARNICSIEHLKGYMSMSPEEEKCMEKVISVHPMNITRYYASLIDWNDPCDPIRKIAVPSGDELDLSGSYDTSGEHSNTKIPGLQHKYPETALILATNRCATYCRFCFRKRLVGLSDGEILHKFESVSEYVKKHEEISNVLISGGDPFKLSTGVLKKFLDILCSIPHLKYIRFGTRIPVAFPQRILWDSKLPKLLRKCSKKKKIYIVTHFNHPREITEQSSKAIGELINSGIPVSNQTVLLRDVNDNPETLVELMNDLVSIGIIPYYVFACRPVKRVKHHFQVPLFEGCRIVESARRKLDGHAKRFRYVMSHVTGKIEIVGTMDRYMYFRYHQAKDPKVRGLFFKKPIKKSARWLDDLDEDKPVV